MPDASMSKRPRVEADPPASATAAGQPAAAPETCEQLHADLAAWCDKELREIATLHSDSVELECDNSAMDSFGDNSFDDFVESLSQDQGVVVEEHKKGELSEAWRRSVADATRVHALMALLSDGTFAPRFNTPLSARVALEAATAASTDAVDEWYFDIAYELAARILGAGGQPCDSSDDNSDDEPVEEEASEEEEDGSESGSGSGAGSESGSDSEA